MNRLEEIRLRRENYVLLREDFDELLDLAEAAVAYCRAKDAMMSGATILERNEWAALSSTLNDAIHRYNATLDMLRQDVPS